MSLPIYQVDAFADRLFEGNPAAVVVLQQALSDEKMQSIAAENNLSETAFVLGGNGSYEICWFTPLAEVALCGHATLASAAVLFEFYEQNTEELIFQTRSRGTLKVRKGGRGYWLDFPADSLGAAEAPKGLLEAMGSNPQGVYKGKTDYLLEYASQAEVEALAPDFVALKALDVRGIIATAKGEEHDFVSRFFGPAVGINEDPVTGSAHTSLTPFWANKLGKNELEAAQLSKRGGKLTCHLKGDRVCLSGNAVLYMQGTLGIE